MVALAFMVVDKAEGIYFLALYRKGIDLRLLFAEGRLEPTSLLGPLATIGVGPGFSFSRPCIPAGIT